MKKYMYSILYKCYAIVPLTYVFATRCYLTGVNNIYFKHEQNGTYIVYLVFVRIDFLHIVTNFIVSKIKTIDSCLSTHIILHLKCHENPYSLLIYWMSMLDKCMWYILVPPVVGAINAAVPSAHAQPDMHLFSDSKDTGSMSGDHSSGNGQPSTSSASEKKIKYDNLPDGEDQQYFVAHCSSLSQLLEDFHCPDCASKGLAKSIIKNEQMGYAAKNANCV